MQKRGGSPHRVHGRMTVPAQLDVQAASVPRFSLCPQRRREIDRPFTEHEMFMDTTHHVLDMDVHDPRSPSPEVACDVTLLETMDVADIYRELEQRVPD